MVFVCRLQGLAIYMLPEKLVSQILQDSNKTEFETEFSTELKTYFEKHIVWGFHVWLVSRKRLSNKDGIS